MPIVDDRSGSGAGMALAFASAVGAPERFGKSRAVGAHVGLAPRRWQSGEAGCSGRLSRRGDAMLRSLPDECASCLTIFGAAGALFTALGPFPGGAPWPLRKPG